MQPSDGEERSDEVQLEVDRASPATMPSCNDGMEVHFFSTGSRVMDTWITRSGKLVTTKYDEAFPHGDFCVDRTSSGDLVAVMCNPCSEKLQCIHLCCPHGQAFMTNPDYDYADFDSLPSICVKIDGGVEYHPEVWDKEHERLLEWERNKHYILVAPALGRPEEEKSIGFQCPNEYAGLSYVPDDLGDFKILSDGSLEGSNLTDYEASKDGLVKTTSISSPDTYCMIIGTPPDYSDYGEDKNDTDEDTSEELKQTYMQCAKPEEESWQETFTGDFQPVALIISVVFLFLTLIVYLLEKELRGTLVGKITVGFIMNLSVCFIVIADSDVKNGDKSFDRRGTTSCILSGYLIIYFFQSFFFWLNAMAINIWLPFSSFRTKFDNISETKRFILCSIYAQGLPLVICAIIAIIDDSGKGKSSSELQLYPEMGVYSCFLGSQKTISMTSYFTSPVFLYHQSVVILVQISNLVFLVSTWRQVCQAGDGHQDQERSGKQRKRHQFSLFVKLFFILGFQWSADLLSTALSVEHGFDETFFVRLFLDLVNLFAGVLIFIVLICNKPVLKRIKQRIVPDTNTQDIKMSVVQEQLSSSVRERDTEM